MTDSLLPYYSRELDALRCLASDFAEAHPKIAGRLRLGANTVDDPHVERLLEGVAFLSARAQQRLDDEFPEISDALLNALYPHYLAPVPSGAIVQFTCKPNLRVPVTVPPGTMLDTEPAGGEAVRFRTAYANTLWPIEIEAVRLSGLPLAAPPNPAARGACSSLRVTLKLADPEASFAELGTGELRCFLRGPLEQAMALYELLVGHVCGVALADGPNDDRPTPLPAASVQPAGFAPEEALYPWSARSFSGFRLLTEYFALPEKFLFIDFKGLDARTLAQETNRLDLFIYFDQAVPALERQLNRDCLALGCTPVVNLFPRQCEPIALDGTRTEYPITPDYRRPRALEVWSVERVREVAGDGTSKPWRPFYRQPGAATSAAVSAGEPSAGVFNVIRRDSPGAVGGTDVLLAPFEPRLTAASPADKVLSVDALCTNRDLPRKLPFGGDLLRLSSPDGLSSVDDIVCLTPPTSTLRAPLRERRSWRLISHLSLGHLSIVGGPDAADSLREVLRLYDVRGAADSRAAIAGLIGVWSREATARVPGTRLGSFCRGLDVTLEFEPDAWKTGGLFLLASVLARFLALHVTVNSFVRTNAVLQGRPGSVGRFAARAGGRVLL